ncbi:hypothetical protein [Salisediminibacterium halotolerans]|uniref:Uncharacterized protein n=1 Tax=Salisediminibacterium halotolerans TaxID=517425 RepID=A0A1H9VP97_9BACI|nr:MULTISPECIES: hypothetical protein [Salisediminibacterium]RLJ75430.1 hypothetical protein BCL39_0944 [Actinophytocola xinjiangensis]RPE89283.1 hypothetical protein EDD67_0057 [Salisediminibacterium halotolerans]TWG36043.1 hypothetical protein BCL52_0942 [Salisediminibacterium halotolerans]SES23389.1 hypothetical protein SAMN05444126_12246 [Salisediminibacterium haloalkalitolerans]GEL07500.1 hypothetical protein SHA02_09160 [Salisediminibacterium halotolerans]
MKVIFDRRLTELEQERIRQLVGFYRGISLFRNDRELYIEEKENFSSEACIMTLKSTDVPIAYIETESYLNGA